MDSGRVHRDVLIREQVSALCAEFGACAAGYWSLHSDRRRLIQVVFVAGVGLDPSVGEEFAAATREVSLSDETLGIVVAVSTGQTAVSEAANLAADAGSGRWLRAFGASRSVAVPIRTEDGMIRGVFSIALRAETMIDDRLIARRIQEAVKD
jgi:hypothetical protein